MEISYIFSLEEAILILLQLLPQVDQLIVVDPEITEVSADLIGPLQFILRLSVLLDHSLDLIQFPFVSLKDRQIPINDLLHKII